MAEALDFQIDTMKFRLAVDNTYYSSNNTGRRYVRSTAPFRKDQIDTSGEAGDQSLTGWWTRGQFSFHEGDGIKYYEVSGPNSTLYRFQDSSGVNPWTPGEVKCATDGRGYYRSAFMMPAYTGTGWQGASAVGNNVSVFCIAYNESDSSSIPSLYECVPFNQTYTKVTTAGARAVAVCHGNSLDDIYIAVDNHIEKVNRATSGGYATPLASSVLWTNNRSATAADNLFVQVFWAKERLWALDCAGNWYTLTPDGGTIAAGDDSSIFWKAGGKYWSGSPTAVADPRSSDWQFAETVGPVYLSTGTRVYKVDVDTTGATPVISTPVVVAELGDGVAVKQMAACPGYLGLTTGTGFRIAAIASDGSIELGPIVIELPDWDTAYSMGSVGGRFYFAARTGPSSTVVDLFEVDTSRQIDTLLPVWAVRQHRPYSAAYTVAVITYGTNVICTTYASADEVGWCAVDYETLQEGGYITTGYHRFATLDDKQFHSVMVEVGGTGGSIDVYQVAKDGTEVMLGNIAFNETKKEFPFATTAGVEAMALKFAFHIKGQNDTDGYDGPVLYGYQIRALPVPKRQRLIQVPLLLRDVITTANGRKTGREGDAWKNLQALEALESSKAIVSFEDFRTGETGTAYIDGVEFTGDIETSHRTREFGGIAYVELRVIS